jgi:hypothetical protein
MGEIALVYNPALVKDYEDEDEGVEYIEMGPVTKEHIENIEQVLPKVTIGHPPIVKDMTKEQFDKAISCYDDLVSVMIYPGLEGVLKHLQTKSKGTLTWEDGRLAINGVQTKLRACEAYEATRVLCKFSNEDKASQKVAELFYDKISELF